MGVCIAQYFAMHGHKVYLYNRTVENLQKAMKRIEDNMYTLSQMDYIKEEEIQTVMNCVIPEENLETAVREADYIIENVAEKVVFQRLVQHRKLHL